MRFAMGATPSSPSLEMTRVRQKKPSLHQNISLIVETRRRSMKRRHSATSSPPPRLPLPFLAFPPVLREAIHGHLGFWEKHHLRATTSQLASEKIGAKTRQYWPANNYVEDIIISANKKDMRFVGLTRCGEVGWLWSDGSFHFYYGTYKTMARNQGGRRIRCKGRLTDIVRTPMTERGRSSSFKIEGFDGERALTVVNHFLRGMKSGAVGLYVWPETLDGELLFPLGRLTILRINSPSMIFKICPEMASIQLKWLFRNGFPLDNLAAVQALRCEGLGHGQHWFSDLWRFLNVATAAQYSKMLFQFDGWRYITDAVRVVRSIARWFDENPVQPDRSRTIVVTFTIIVKRKDMEVLRQYQLRMLPKPTRPEIEIGLSVVRRRRAEWLFTFCLAEKASLFFPYAAPNTTRIFPMGFRMMIAGAATE
ncbi:unnamed protein product, partial [Mesorhabditis spiculigera]